MVDSVSNMGGAPQIKRTGEDTTVRAKGAKTGAPAAPSTPSTGAGDTMEIKAATVAVPKELKTPPIELESVTRIQEAIAKGDYPIDLSAITESLFQSYLELNN